MAEGRFTRDDISRRPLDVSDADKTYRYPSDLGGDEFPAWVTFYPLIRKGAMTALGNAGNSVINSGANLTEFDMDGQMRMDPENTTLALAAGGIEQGVTAAASSIGVSGLKDILGTGGGNTTGNSSLIQKVEGLMSAGGSVVMGGLAGGGAAGILGMAINNDDHKLMFGSKSISLGIHNSITQKYSARWETADLGAIMGAVGSGDTEVSKAMSGGFMDAAGTLLDVTGDVGKYALRKIGTALGNNQMGAAMEAGTKKVENPYKEQLFKNMDFRTFEFEYKFMPKSEYEMQEVFGDRQYQAAEGANPGILNTFLMHLHPTNVDSGLYLMYPSEFLIVFYYKGAENDSFRRISNCALNDVSITYGGEGMQFFQNAQGAPSEVTLKLKFTELETLTTQRINKGY